MSDLGPKDVAVRMLFAPINPSDVNQVGCVGFAAPTAAQHKPWSRWWTAGVRIVCVDDEAFTTLVLFAWASYPFAALVLFVADKG